MCTASEQADVARLAAACVSSKLQIVYVYAIINQHCF